MDNPLCLNDWWASAGTPRKGVSHIAAQYLIEPDACPKCGVVGRLYRHGYKMIDYCDAPSYGKQTQIVARVHRYRCRDCNQTFMQPLPDMATEHRMTKRCVEWIGEQGIPRTYAEIARDVGVKEKTVRRICGAYFEREMAKYSFETPVVLGIDELQLRKRMRAIFMDIGTGRPIDLIASHSKRDVAMWLSQLPNKERVKAVTIDMTGHYEDVIRAILPKALVVIDKFHLVRKANDALKDVRAKDRSKAAGGDGKNPHYNVFLLRTRAHRLNPMQEMELDGLRANKPVVGDAHRAKERFFNIYNAANRKEAEHLFAAWEASLPDNILIKRYFGRLARTVRNWREEVFAYFDCRITNASTEGRNGIVKIANRAGRGYGFPAIRAKAILAKPLGAMRDCSSCNGEFPASSFRNDVCGSCHYRFHTGEGSVIDVDNLKSSTL